MDNAQKAIMIGVGLFITIIVIAAAMVISSMGQDIVNSGTAKLENVQTNLENSIIENDAKAVGTKVSYIKARSMARNAKDAGIKIMLDTAVVTDIDANFVSSKQYNVESIDNTEYKFTIVP